MTTTSLEIARATQRVISGESTPARYDRMLALIAGATTVGLAALVALCLQVAL